MKNNYTDIEAYLKKTMPPNERKTFEAALKTDTALQKAYILQYLENEPANDDDAGEQNRQLLSDLRQRLGKPEKPQLSWFDHLRFFLASQGKFMLAAAVLGIAAMSLVLWANLSLPSLPQLAQAHFVKPPCLSVAGNDADTKQVYENFKQASDEYCSMTADRREKLERLAKSCGSFCMAHFYLAHVSFENRDFESAQKGFEQCLLNKDHIVQFSQTRDFGKIKMNLALSKIAASKDGKENAAAAIEALLQDADCTGDVLESLKKLQEELAHPLRFLQI